MVGWFWAGLGVACGLAVAGMAIALVVSGDDRDR